MGQQLWRRRRRLGGSICSRVSEQPSPCRGLHAGCERHSWPWRWRLFSSGRHLTAAVTASPSPPTLPTVLPVTPTPPHAQPPHPAPAPPPAVCCLVGSKEDVIPTHTHQFCLGCDPGVAVTTAAAGRPEGMLHGWRLADCRPSQRCCHSRIQSTLHMPKRRGRNNR